jgi:hypothetical protein
LGWEARKAEWEEVDGVAREGRHAWTVECLAAVGDKETALDAVSTV